MRTIFTQSTDNKRVTRPTAYRSDTVQIPYPYVGYTLNSNIDIEQRLRESSRRIVTNNRGWRVSAPNQEARKTDLLLIGCSWTEGQMEDWDDTLAGHLNRLTGRPVTNLGVGGYSPLQAIRRLEMEVDIAKPNTVVFTYADTTDRLVKINGLQEIAFKPIFRFDKKMDDVAIIEPAQPPAALFNEYVELARAIRSGRSTARQRAERKIITIFYQLENGYARRFIASRCGLRRYLNIPVRSIGEQWVRDSRHRMLDICFSQLQALADRYCFKVCLIPATKYLISTPHEAFQFDLEYFDSLPKRFNCISVGSLDRLRTRVLSYLESVGASELRPGNYVWASDNPHPNSAGYRLLAETVYEQLVTSATLSPATER